MEADVLLVHSGWLALRVAKLGTMASQAHLSPSGVLLRVSAVSLVGYTAGRTCDALV